MEETVRIRYCTSQSQSRKNYGRELIGRPYGRRTGRLGSYCRPAQRRNGYAGKLKSSEVIVSLVERSGIEMFFNTGNKMTTSFQIPILKMGYILYYVCNPRCGQKSTVMQSNKKKTRARTILSANPKTSHTNMWVHSQNSVHIISRTPLHHFSECKESS